jgi:hypothetical protein
MTREEYLQHFKEESAPGWEAIDRACARIYSDQEPRHMAPIISPMLGGPDPIMGISMYQSLKGRPHTHLVSYGMSALFFDPDLAGKEFSGRGFEFTARIAPFEADGAQGPMWMVQVMNNLARYLIEADRWFEEGHFINANGPLRLDTDTSLTAMAFVRDPELGLIDTPHGQVEFLQIVGLTSAQYEDLRAKSSAEHTLALLGTMRAKNPMLVIDLAA